MTKDRLRYNLVSVGFRVCRDNENMLRLPCYKAGAETARDYRSKIRYDLDADKLLYTHCPAHMVHIAMALVEKAKKED